MPALPVPISLLRGGLLLATALLVTGCAGTSDSEAGATTSSASTSSASASTSSQPSPPASSSASIPAGSTIDVSVAGGQVTGDTGRISVPSGDQVTIKVASDVADEIHLHGYDLSAPVGPGTPGTLTFPATIPGVFEVELEQRGTLLFTLQVG